MKMQSSMKNDYLEQVLNNQMQVQDELAKVNLKKKARRRVPKAPPRQPQ
jgi:hypothetical protein